MQRSQVLRGKLKHSSPQCNAPVRRGCAPGRGHSHRHRGCWHFWRRPPRSPRVRAWTSEQQAESWSWQEWRRQERWRQRWPWSHEFRDHGFGPTGIVPAVPRVVQGDVLEVPEGAGATPPHPCANAHKEGKPYKFCHCLQSKLNLSSLSRPSEGLPSADERPPSFSHSPNAVKLNTTVRPLLVAADDSVESVFFGRDENVRGAPEVRGSF